jgi:hypothetical protein
MRVCVYATCLTLTLLPFTRPVMASAYPKGIKMTEIDDAGIYCASVTKSIASFYKVVEMRCTGKLYCVIRATMVATPRELEDHKCTGFFVAPICNGRPRNVESRFNVMKRLRVSCG